MKVKNQKKVSETMIPNTPPVEMYDLQLERALLGIALLERESLNKLLLQLRPEYFHDSNNQLICRAIFDMNSESISIDLLTVTSYLRKYLLLEQVGGAYYITQLTTNVNSGENFDSHAQFLVELYTRRELYRSCLQWATNVVNQDVFSILSNVNTKMLEFTTQMSPKTVPSIFQNKLKYIEDLERVIRGDLSQYTPTKFALDRIIVGCAKGELIVLAARPGMGKTTLAMNVCQNITSSGFKCGFINLEMSEFDMISRINASATMIPYKKIKQGNLDSTELVKLQNHLSSDSCKNFLIDSTGIASIEHIRAKIYLMHHRDKVRVVAIDYLTLIRKVSNNGAPKDQIIDDIVRDIKLITKELGITCILLAQVNRSVDLRSDKMPTLADCHGSMGIEAHADVVMFMLRPSYYNIDQDHNGQPITQGYTYINVAKNRGGDTGMVALDYQGEIYKFRDYATF